MIHDQIETENATIESIRCLNVSGFDIGNDSLNFHHALPRSCRAP